MNYCDALDFLGSLQFLGSKLGLERVRQLLAAVGNPQEKIKTVHIAGSKGKGSTSMFIDNILQAAGYKVGLFTSPHLQSIRERIRLNGEMISTGEFSDMIAEVAAADAKLKHGELGPATFFEVMTVSAFLYFLRAKVDIAVFEVGLGGRLDATNVIVKPEVCVITPISYEHTQILGKTLDLIAREKAGIIKDGVPVVSARQRKNAEDAIRDVASSKNAPIVFQNKDFDYVDQGCIYSGQMMDYEDKDQQIKHMIVPLLGEHQLQNASLACKTTIALRSRGFNVTDDAIRTGIANTFWPGRMELIMESPLIIIDGAHNGASAEALAHALKKHCACPKFTFVIGMLRDKDTRRFIRSIGPISNMIYATTPDSPRSLDPNVLAQRFRKAYFDAKVVENPTDALLEAIDRTPPDGCVVITGSLYLVAQMRTALGRFHLAKPR
ncbi:MAG: bifunctional folylpolyglutamate synthase/dihydrofolate synthase [Caldisericia bacterium]|nr:bifunctional folylpolyglutamate synthase/dihydrofolate synthase [Caldisericia bacterium]